jgi:methyltransferase-like protein
MDLAVLGRFDFIVAHGVYSWVPPDVQEALLAAFRGSLAPDGVAYCSYNVYPGWKSKEIIRDAMLLASGASTTPDAKARDARGMLDFLEEVAPAEGVLARVVAESKAFAEGFGDSYLLHDELETFNAPCYFYEMVTRAGAHGLAYLAEARPETMVPANFGPRVAEYVTEKSGGVQVLVEQYLDFVTNRMFRESLLVHAERTPMISYTPTRDRFADLHFAAFVPPVDDETRMDNSRQEYRESDGATLFTNDPGIKAALDELSSAWPWTLSRTELVEAVSARLAAAGLAPSVNVDDHVDNLMGTLILQGQARFRLDPVRTQATITPLTLDETSRRMAELTSDRDDASTFNPWHETEMLPVVDRHLLPLLDGSRDREELVDALVGRFEADAIPLELDGVVVSGDGLRDALAAFVDQAPERLAEMKLLPVSKSRSAG